RAFDNLAKAAAHTRSNASNSPLSIMQQQHLFNEKRYWEHVEREFLIVFILNAYLNIYQSLHF
ncbi:unnamed protein product, partial [Rotaria magnacalcarata]